MLLREQIVQDLKDAMKSGDTHTRDTLRSLDSMIKNEEIAQNKREEGLEDAGTISLVKRAIKQRKDSASQYREGDRSDLAEKEEKEMCVIEKYLPEQMSEQEIAAIVETVIAESGATTKADMGKVIGAVMSKVGIDADGSVVRDVVDKALS